MNRGHPAGWGAAFRLGEGLRALGGTEPVGLRGSSRVFLAIMNESSGPRGLATSHRLGIKVAWRAPSVYQYFLTCPEGSDPEGVPGCPLRQVRAVAPGGTERPAPHGPCCAFTSPVPAAAQGSSGAGRAPAPPLRQEWLR